MSGETIYDPSEEQKVSHYHGDFVRGLFVTAAILVFLTQFAGTKLPFSVAGLMLIIVVLAVAAGITNPVQLWIHWVNLVISIIGLLIFGGLAFARLSSSADFILQNGLVSLLAIVFFVAIYFATRTLRGLMVPHVDQGEKPISLEPYD